MGVIKGVLKEELANSIVMAERYQEEIDKLKGALIKKKIGRRYYYYLAKREGLKVKFVYQGPASSMVKKAYVEKQKSIARYKKLLAKVKHQVRFLRRALRGKEPV